MQQIKVHQKRSAIGCSEHQRKVLRGLGLRHRGSTIVHKDNNCIRGMINKVIHLVDFEFVNAKK